MINVIEKSIKDILGIVTEKTLIIPVSNIGFIQDKLIRDITYMNQGMFNCLKELVDSGKIFDDYYDETTNSLIIFIIAFDALNGPTKFNKDVFMKGFELAINGFTKKNLGEPTTYILEPLLFNGFDMEAVFENILEISTVVGVDINFVKATPIL